MSAVYQVPGQVQALPPRGFAGLPFLALLMTTALNTAPQAAQVSTVTVSSSPTASVVYTLTFTIQGTSYNVSVTSSSTSANTLATQFKDAIDADFRVRGYVNPTVSTNVVTLTGMTAGLAFTVVAGDATTSAITTIATTTAADSADPIYYGDGLLDRGLNTDAGTGAGISHLASLPDEAYMSAQVATLTVTYRASAQYQVQITVKNTGERVICVVAADTDSNTTAAAINAEINAKMSANSVIATVATNVVTLTAEVDGIEFEVVTETGTNADLVLANTTPASNSTSLVRAFFGVAAYNARVPLAAPPAEEAYYPGNSSMMVLREGEIWVTLATVPTYGSPVFVAVNSAGGGAGKFFTTGGAGRVQLPLSMASWLEGDGIIGRLRLNLTAPQA